jgi:hypothetical protein
MLKKSTMKAIPLAAAMTAALMLVAPAQAQTGSATMNNAPTGIGGTTNGKDATNPDPRAGNGSSARAGADGNTNSGSGMNLGATATPGTTKGKDNVSPEPMAGNGSSARMGMQGTTDMSPQDPNMTHTPGTTNSKDNVSPSPMAGKGMTAEERATAQADRKASKAAKRASRMKKNKSEGSMGMGSPAPSGDMDGTAPSPSK